MTIIGTAIASYNVFNFSSRTSDGLCLPTVECGNITGAQYFYTNQTLILIAIGCSLIVTGILILKNNK